MLPVEPETKLEYITCPCCGMSRKLWKSGKYAKRRDDRGVLLRRPLGSKQPGRVRFDAMDLENALILQVRDATQALRVIEGKTLSELSKDANYADLVAQLQAQIEIIRRILS